MLAVEEERFAEAHRLLDKAAAGLQAAGEEYAVSTIDSLRITARIEEGGPIAAYNDPNVKETGVNQIMSRLSVESDGRRSRNWPCFSGRARRGASAAGTGRAHALWSQADYAGVVEFALRSESRRPGRVELFVPPFRGGELSVSQPASSRSNRRSVAACFRRRRPDRETTKN